jgi:hypothetical protein
MAPAVPRAAWAEVPRADWVRSLERFSREHRAWLAFVEPGAEHPLRR